MEIKLKSVRSQRWGYVRIIAGTIFGGILGFYVMHRAEISYKAKWEERLEKYKQEKMRREQTLNQIQDHDDDDNALYFADNVPAKEID